MTIVVEDGTIVATANSFASLDYADTYFSRHPHLDIQWGDLSGEKREIYLLWAAQQMSDLFQWRGDIVSVEQTLSWPRKNVCDNEGRPVPSDSIPERIKQAQCEMAIYLSTGDQETSSGTADLDEVKVDVISIKFRGSSSAKAVPRPAARLLRGLGTPYSAIRVTKVVV